MVPKINSEFESTKILGNAIVSFSKIFQRLNPDMNLILGWTNMPDMQLLNYLIFILLQQKKVQNVFYKWEKKLNIFFM